MIDTSPDMEAFWVCDCYIWPTDLTKDPGHPPPTLYPD